MKPKLVGAKTSELVIFAIHDLETSDTKETGFTEHDITKHISAKYKLDYAKIKPLIKSALSRGLSFGIFNHQNGRYRLEDVPEPPLDYEAYSSKEGQNVKTECEKPRRKRKMKENKTNGGRQGGKFICKECYEVASSMMNYNQGIEDETSESDENDWTPANKRPL